MTRQDVSPGRVRVPPAAEFGVPEFARTAPCSHGARPDPDLVTTAAGRAGKAVDR